MQPNSSRRLLGWLAALALLVANGSAAEVPADKRELLAEHETVAQFEGIEYRLCRGLTTLCPRECGDSGEFAKFKIVKYVRFVQHGKYGSRQKSFVIQVSDYHRQPRGDASLLATVRTLQPGEYVRLDWHHDYVTRAGASYPERPVVKLEAISNAEAQKLLKEPEAHATKPADKLQLDLAGLDADGLRGGPGGKVALAYEFSIPDRTPCRDEVRSIDRTVEFHPGSRGRVGAGPGDCLCIGSTHQPHHREVLQRLAALPYVHRIIRCDFE